MATAGTVNQAIVPTFCPRHAARLRHSPIALTSNPFIASPTASRSASKRSAYTSSVMAALLWPSCRCTALTFAPHVHQQRGARVSQVMHRHRRGGILVKDGVLRTTEPIATVTSMRTPKIRAGAPVGEKQIGRLTALARPLKAWSEQTGKKSPYASRRSSGCRPRSSP